MEVQTPVLAEHTLRLEAGVRRLAAAVIFTAFLLAGVQLYLGGAQGLAAASAAGAAVAFLWLIFTRTRR